MDPNRPQHNNVSLSQTDELAVASDRMNKQVTLLEIERLAFHFSSPSNTNHIGIRSYSYTLFCDLVMLNN